MSPLYTWPDAARLDRRIPRDQLFRRAGGGKTIRALYEAQVERIDWAFKLFERTVNLPAGAHVAEIQVIQVSLRSGELDDRVLAHIDKALPRQTWFELSRPSPDGPEVQSVAAFKRTSDADRSKVVMHEHWRGNWLPATAPRKALPVAVNLDGLYAGLLRSLWPHPARADENVRSQADRLSEIATQAKAVERVKAAVRRETDFARQVEKNRELRVALARLNELTD